ncbi:TIGR02569 family protein [Saccharothrix sp. NPDC042600]|uniref:TIGR02569 family protein n=1 Tax=Saccharothrix TaxID=2071 RepID=UPI0033D33ECD|nr:TIGR02569 family protein [Saccharothrix mutabilis subsp. capreolus]
MLPPSPAVLAAFGTSADPVLLPGGQGRAWRAGQVVVKPVDSVAETVWRAEVLAALPDSPAFRVSRPVRTADGGWTHDGWEAGLLVAGEPDVSRQDDVLRAATAFHAAIADVPRPAFLDARDDPWSHGDRVAWEERPVDGSAEASALLAPLVAARRPVDLVSQAVHGDLPGNVLFAPGLPPAVIDWSVYWRPTSWAAAVAVADALCWYDAEPGLVARWSHLPAWRQALVRALIYRVVTHDKAAFGWSTDVVATYRRVTDLVLS